MNILGSILDGWFFWMNIVDMILNWILKWIVFNVWINNWNLSPRFTLWGLRLTEQECSIWIGMVNGEMVVFINNNNSQLVNWQGHKGGGHGGRGGGIEAQHDRHRRGGQVTRRNADGRNRTWIIVDTEEKPDRVCGIWMKTRKGAISPENLSWIDHEWNNRLPLETKPKKSQITQTYVI